MDRKKLALVVPCFNEEETLKSNITKLINTLEDLIQKSLITQDSFICFIDDGSNDKSAEIIKKYSVADSRIKYYYQQQKKMQLKMKLTNLHQKTLNSTMHF